MALAEQIAGEIITVDSMQVYQGLDIGTAKPSLLDRQRVPHHLVDIVTLKESFDAARFVQRAREAVAAIQARGKVPVFCGGTGLYFQAYLRGLDAPAADPRLRAELEATPLPELLVRLEEADPERRWAIDGANRRRVVRALEVILLTGQPGGRGRSVWSRRVGSEVSTGSALFFGLNRSREDLRERIERRVDAMFQVGLVEETRALLGQGLERNRNAMQALGYRQVVEHLRGERSLAETITLVKQKTWQFARRQMTWLRHQLPVEWVELAKDAEPAAVARHLIERCGPEVAGGRALPASRSENRT